MGDLCRYGSGGRVRSISAVVFCTVLRGCGICGFRLLSAMREKGRPGFIRALSVFVESSAAAAADPGAVLQVEAGGLCGGS
jgi:hypothetical protein